jgi:GrpB-like predicted nucleotidyltransferase (UPF0157 family)
VRFAAKEKTGKTVEIASKNLLRQKHFSPVFMIGLERGTVRLSEYNPEWQRLFAEEAEVLREMLGDCVLEIQHVGSTSIKGLTAKPIIDIAAALRKIEDVAQCVKPLESIGYEYKGENGIPERHFFAKGNPRKFHLHFVKKDGNLWRNYINFRNRLRENVELKNEYARIKKDSAKKYEQNRAAYTESKEPFIEKVLKQKNYI